MQNRTDIAINENDLNEVISTLTPLPQEFIESTNSDNTILYSLLKARAAAYLVNSICVKAEEMAVINSHNPIFLRTYFSYQQAPDQTIIDLIVNYALLNRTMAQLHGTTVAKQLPERIQQIALSKIIAQRFLNSLPSQSGFFAPTDHGNGHNNILQANETPGFNRKR